VGRRSGQTKWADEVGQGEYAIASKKRSLTKRDFCV
jgi:hypothetical protein